MNFDLVAITGFRIIVIMKKVIFILFVFLSSASFAQVSGGYVFSCVTSPAHAFISGGTTLASGNGASMDDALYTNIPVGFTANFNGTDYTTVGVSTNGFLWFGTVNPAATEYTPISSATVMSGVIPGYGANPVVRVRASELNNDRFIVERSADGLEFPAIGAGDQLEAGELPLGCLLKPELYDMQEKKQCP